MRRALSFLTPLGGSTAPSPAALAWFPVVGAALGVVVGGLWWTASEIWPPAVAAALVVAADLALTGMLHFDGLVDSADGLLPSLDRPRRLEVMADPRAGSFGVGAAVTVLLLRWSALSAMRPHALLLAGLWCASRTTMAVTARSVPYARNGGLATAFLAADGDGRRRVGIAAAGLAGSIVLAGAAGRGLGGLAAVVAAVAGATGVVVLARRRLGGFTGDVLGAAGMVGETAGLLAAAVRW